MLCLPCPVLVRWDLAHYCRGYQIDSTSCATHVHLTPFLIPSLCCPSLATWLISNEQTAVALSSLLNDYQISNHRPLLSWLNPWLYDPIIQAVASTTSQLGITQAVTLSDSLQPTGGILFIPPCLCLFISGIADS